MGTLVNFSWKMDNEMMISDDLSSVSTDLCDDTLSMDQDDIPDKDKLSLGGRRSSSGKRGRKPAKVDVKAKLERSRQSARECRARKKLRYQYLEELVACRERAIHALRDELEIMKQVCGEVDKGEISPQTLQYVEQEKMRLARRQQLQALGQRQHTSSSSSSDLMPPRQRQPSTSA